MRISWLFGACLSLAVSVSAENKNTETFLQKPEVQKFVDDLVANHGFSRDELHKWFDQGRMQVSIIKALTRPAEKTKTYVNYKPMFVSPDTIKRGRAFEEQHRVALERAEFVYGVPREVILSIIAIESRFGRLKGKYRVFDALSTIAFYYPKRARYFTKELREFLLIAKQEGIDPLTVKGSYAGAMGYPQFMPSSFRAYAVDFDFDGKIDIWENPVDAIGSVANYFAKHGWRAGEQVTLTAKVSGDTYLDIMPKRMKLQTTYGEIKKYGWQVTEATVNTPLTDKTKVLPFQLETENGMEYWVGLKNFYVITRYNHSRRYAMTVHQLSQLFAEGQSREK